MSPPLSGSGPMHHQVPDRCALPSWRDSHQIDDCEYADPNDVERVPEQRKALEAAHYVGTETHGGDLRHHHQEPDQACADMQPMAANERKERGKKCAALRGRARGDHARELVELEAEETQAEREGHKSTA